MDALAVKRGCEWAKEWVLSGKGPLVMEMRTYRYGGHSMSDPGTTYRSRDEIQRMRSTADPITHLRNLIIEQNVATEAEIKAIDKEARKLIEKETQEAEASPEPDLKEFWSDIYIKGTEPYTIRGRVPSESHRFH